MNSRPSSFKKRQEKMLIEKDGARKAERKHLESIGHVANILLCIVAIFGYFYTVRPIYQKDRLEEEVARYEKEISKQIPLIDSLKEQSTQLIRDRDVLTSELSAIQRDLEKAKSAHLKAKNEMQYMDYIYYLPDGTPATSVQQVEQAKTENIKNAFLSRTSLVCALGVQENAFSGSSYAERSVESEHYPFTEKEVEQWNKFGISLPKERAVKCINVYFSKYFEKFSDKDREKYDAYRKRIIELIMVESSNALVSLSDLVEINAEYKEMTNKITKDEDAEIAAHEKEYEHRDKAFGAANRAILQNNYEVEKTNIKSKFQNERFTLQYQFSQKARDYDKIIQEETIRVIKAVEVKLKIYNGGH